MKKQVYDIDKDGYIKYIYVATVDDYGNILDEDLQHCIPTDPIHGLLKPRWNGTAWVEGESSEEKAEREAQQMLESLKPSQNEIEDAELEIKMITLLTEMGVIQ